METLKLKAKTREIKGKKVKNLRKEGFLPTVLYGKDIKTQSLVVSKKEFQKVFKSAGENALVDLNIDDRETKKVLISDSQVDPVTGEPIHADFHQVKLTEKVSAEVPLEFVKEEESPAIRELEGTLVKEKDSIEVESLPQDIPYSIEVDVSQLKTFDDIIHISDLKVPANVEVLDNPDEVVALVMPPRSEEELKELEEEVVEDVEKVEGVEEEKGEEEEVPEEGGEEKAEETGEKKEETEQNKQ